MPDRDPERRADERLDKDKIRERRRRHEFQRPVPRDKAGAGDPDAEKKNPRDRFGGRDGMRMGEFRRGGRRDQRQR